MDAVVRPLTQLAMDNVEQCLMAAIIVFTGDGPMGMCRDGRTVMGKIRDRYLQLLRHHITNKFNGEQSMTGLRLARLMLLVTSITRLTLQSSDSVQLSDNLILST